MIRKAKELDKEIILRYIGKDYPKCLYLYMDLCQYGVNSEYTETWILISEKEICGVVLFYHSAMHAYSRNPDCCLNELVSLVNDKKPSIICATSELIRPLAIKLPQYMAEYGHIGKMGEMPQMEASEVERAGIGDVEAIARLLYEDEGIGASYDYGDLVQQMKERLAQGFVRSYVIKDSGKVVAHIGTGAEVGNVCTITYVITDSAYRRQGLSQKLFARSCTELRNEGFEIYSVYYVPGARQLHHKMGFYDYCEYGKLFINID